MRLKTRRMTRRTSMGELVGVAEVVDVEAEEADGGGGEEEE